MGCPSAVATCALKSLDVNRIFVIDSLVTTVSGQRGVGAVMKSSVRPPRSSWSPARMVRSRARRPEEDFHAAVRASLLAGVSGLSAA